MIDYLTVITFDFAVMICIIGYWFYKFHSDMSTRLNRIEELVTKKR